MAPTVVRSTDAARAFIAPPWGGWEGIKWRSQPRAPCGCGRNQAFFVLMACAGLVGETPCAGKILRRTAVQRGLDRFVMPGTVRASMGGKGASATGWGYTIAGRRLDRCRAIPLSGWVVAEAWLTRTAAALRRPGGHISSRSDTAFSFANIGRMCYICRREP